MNDTQKLVDASCYEALQAQDPAIITAIEAALDAGATPTDIGKVLSLKFGTQNLVASAAIGAAWHIKRQRDLAE